MRSSDASHFFLSMDYRKDLGGLGIGRKFELD